MSTHIQKDERIMDSIQFSSLPFYKKDISFQTVSEGEVVAALALSALFVIRITPVSEGVTFTANAISSTYYLKT